MGLSLDGPADCHDAYRTKADGSTSHGQVMKTLDLLQKHQVFVNLLCVLQARNTAEPDRVYRFFKDVGARYLQFLPYVPRPGRDHPAPAASPDQIGAFLSRVFDLWAGSDVGSLVIQTFDEALRPLYGLPHALCVHRETCGDVLVLEHDGGVYACDHFVGPDHLLGNLRDTDLAVLAADLRLKAFGQAKKDGLAPECQNCAVLDFCHGGCPKDRDSRGLNRLCPGFKAFFTHAQPTLTALAAHMKAGKPLRSFRP